MNKIRTNVLCGCVGVCAEGVVAVGVDLAGDTQDTPLINVSGAQFFPWNGNERPTAKGNRSVFVRYLQVEYG